MLLSLPISLSIPIIGARSAFPFIKTKNKKNLIYICTLFHDCVSLHLSVCLLTISSLQMRNVCPCNVCTALSQCATTVLLLPTWPLPSFQHE